MKTHDSILRSLARLAALAALCVLVAGCGRASERKGEAHGASAGSATSPTWAQGLVNTSTPACSVLSGATGLKYFGFFCSSCQGVGNGSYTDEVKDFVNLIHVSSKDIPFLRREFEKARALGLKVMADATAFNIGIDFPNFAGGNFDYWWAIYRPVFAPYVSDGTIIGFYVSDDAPVSHAQDRDLHIIKTSFDRPVVTVNIVQSPYQALPGQWSSEIDWVGVETYSGVDKSGIEYMLSLLPATTKLVLVPAMSSIGSSFSVSQTLSLATNNPRVVGIIPFLWQDATPVVGARNIPEYRALGQQLGACIKGAAAPPPARTLTIDPVQTSGNGSSGVLQVSATDTYGAAQISRIQVLVNSSAGGANACLAYYDPSNGKLGLLNDAGNAWIGFTPLGSGASIENSQCRIHPANSSASRQGNTLRLGLAVEFKPAFSGSKTIYAEAYEATLGSTGYKAVGTWSFVYEPPFNGIKVSSLAPSNGTGASTNLTVSVLDSSGASRVNRVQLLVSPAGAAANACLVYFDRATGYLYLLNNSGSAFDSSGAIGSGAILQNSQCRVRTSGSSFSAQGTTLQLTVALDFLPGFSGQKAISAEAYDPAFGSTGYQAMGSWFVPYQ